jgi:hypothetical protein
MAEVAPGREAALASAGTFTDPGLRTHEVFTPNERAAERRSRRYNAIAVVLAIALVTGAVVKRSSTPNQQPFVDAVLERTEPYWRKLLQRVAY